MLRIQIEDTSAFGVLMKRYEPALFNFLRRMTGNTADAEELFQETFLRVYQHRARFDATLPFKPWLYRIATNCCNDRLRYRMRRPSFSLDAPVDDDSAVPLGARVANGHAGPAEHAREHELQERLAGAVKALPVKQRSVFLMARYDGMSYEAIGQALEIPVGTVKSRMNTAVTFLMEQLNEFLP